MKRRKEHSPSSWLPRRVLSAVSVVPPSGTSSPWSSCSFHSNRRGRGAGVPLLRAEPTASQTPSCPPPSLWSFFGHLGPRPSRSFRGARRRRPGGGPSSEPRASAPRGPSTRFLRFNDFNIFLFPPASVLVTVSCCGRCWDSWEFSLYLRRYRVKN